MKSIESIAQKLVASGKGILAADESHPTIQKRFKAIDLESTEENRRTYRQMLFTTEGLGNYISGVILFDETLRQKADDGTPFPEVLQRQGIIPGIKVDRGAKPLAGFPGEKVTEGLDGLRDRLEEYAQLGARFTKWRAVINLGEDIPSAGGIAAHAHALARFAALSQEAGMVPIVEPEVLMDGPHTLARHGEVTETVIEAVFHALAQLRVRREAMLLKPNMVLSGTTCPAQAGVEEVAEATLRCMLRVVPAAVPGLVFLSGGQSDVTATRHLNALNERGHAPWELSFSFGRALQAPALQAWKHASQDGGASAQKALLHRAQCNSAARFGHYAEDLTTADFNLTQGNAHS